MASTILVTCPECEKQVKVPAETQGKKVRCKACGSSFTAKAAAQEGQAKTAPRPQPKPPAAKPKPNPAPAAKAAPAKPPPKKTGQDDEDDGPGAYTVIKDDLAARCPHCAKEMESEDAIICLHCGYNTRTRSHTEIKRTVANTGMDQFLWLLPGILCVFLIIGLGAFDFWFWIAPKDFWAWMDEALGNKSFSMGTRIWEIIMSLFAMWLAAKFAFKRLVMEPIRPETEKKE